MPLDSHSYLVAQGWSGKGTGLREGAISRPVTVSQKKTLSGVGKDRDEAFPFWDHVFSAASKSIQVKITADDDSSDESSTPTSTIPHLKRTSTGILSNRRPIEGIVATSGSATPESESDTPRLSLIAAAKREAAKRGLYSRFFRGPIVGPNIEPITTIPTAILETEDSQNTHEMRKRKRSVEPSPSTSTYNKTESTERVERTEMKRIKLERKAEKVARKAARAAKRAAKEEKRSKKQQETAVVASKQTSDEGTVESTDPSKEADSKQARKERKRLAKLAADEATVQTPKKKRKRTEATE